jgi:hypothetical protein
MNSTDTGNVFSAWLRQTFGSGPTLGVFGPIFDNAITTILGVLWMLGFIAAVASLLIGLIRLGIGAVHSQSMHVETAQKQIIIAIVLILALIVFVALLTTIATLVR